MWNTKKEKQKHDRQIDIIAKLIMAKQNDNVQNFFFFL